MDGRETITLQDRSAITLEVLALEWEETAGGSIDVEVDGHLRRKEGTMDDRRMRDGVVELLRGGSAHLTWDRALAELAPAHRGALPRRGLHTIWELVEHVRIAQEDILRYALEPGWRSPKWPEGYWPPVKEPTPKQWKASLAAFRRDLEAVVAMVLDPAVDLTAVIPHGQGGHTYLREALLVADHNAHHLGQVVVARRLLGDWK